MRFSVVSWALVVLPLAMMAGCSDYPEVNGSSGHSEGGAAPTTGGSSHTGGRVDINVGGDESTGGTESIPDPVCGNGELEPGEICDDGGTEDDDGCSSDCAEQDPDFLCVPGEACVDTVVCGNGVFEGDEVCDEGEGNETDGCLDECSEIADGWSCPRPGRSCVPIPVCGNGTRERGEECDDDNVESDDGCSEDCELEDGYFCLPGQACVALDCGDGNRTPDEECDDDNTDDGDGCSGECTVEPGYRCSSIGCKPICGDGERVGSEECDDGDLESGDGCSAGCLVEPFYSCDDSTPSVCTSDIECGNGVLEPGEICDPGIAGSDTCYDTGATACRGFDRDRIDSPVCGNDVIEFDEECDGDQGEGCTDDCLLEDGFTCPAANYCLRVPACGDGIVQLGEECDVGAASSVPCQDCEVQDGYYCSGSPSVCVESVCGDGNLAPDEQCDDGNAIANDGCDQCEVQTGWVCPPGLACAPVCGDGVVLGREQCDTTDAGCTNCRIVPGYDCGTSGTSCHATVCGDGNPEFGEGCDDGNHVAGDGCGPTCQLEPTVHVGPNPTVDVKCGDGLKTNNEECDDGNATNGDGCSSSCAVEDGWYCTPDLTYPDYVDFAVTYRDFKGRPEDGGHPDFEWNIETAANMVGAPCTTSNGGTCGRPDTAGKPEFKLSNGTADVTSPATFALWYRDTNTNSVTGQHGVIEIMPVPDSLRLYQDPGNEERYTYPPVGDSSANFYPLTDRGFGNYDTYDWNYHFTTELRYFFQYKGGETLMFEGDDDVWVFINGRLAVDVGGVHGIQYGRVVLGDDGDNGATDSNCSVHRSWTAPSDCSLQAGENTGISDDKRFGLVAGGVYEILFFQAERHTVASNFRLTLEGFLAPRSYCTPDCGDGIVAGTELCDEGDDNADGVYGQCNKSCTFTFCGDGKVNGPETCDNGRNIDLYVTTPDANDCAPGCRPPDYCGDGVMQPAHEVCDDGENDGGYSGCMPGCQDIGGYCGDGVVQDPPETCDDPNGLVAYDGCGFDCQPAPYCGDDIRNGVEQCDGTPSCNDNCEFDPYCGDGLKASSEACDYGQFGYDGDLADAPYGGCTLDCELGPYCGDGDVHKLEECDEGAANADGEYDGCTTHCTYGPRCGDGVAQTIFGEDCDNGFNEDTYLYVADACAPNCEAPPYCGDGAVQGGFELCDDGADNDDDAYEGCTTTCEWGPYCGDGEVQEGYEVCDDGTDNTAYAAHEGGCGYDCRPAPYCGDGVRNGPKEQCDDGTSNNTGEYGGCNEDCTRAPYCGDRIVQKKEGEQCDDGPRGSLTCTVDCRARIEIE